MRVGATSNNSFAINHQPASIRTMLPDEPFTKAGPREVKSCLFRQRVSALSQFVCVLLMPILFSALAARAQNAGKELAERLEALRIKVEQQRLADSANADCDLGSKYFATQNYREALKWFGVAAQKGSARGQYAVGLFHLYGYGVPINANEAAKWLGRAAEQNHAKAQELLAQCFYRGEGVIQDYVIAVKWALRAAEQGLFHAQHNLGVSYHEGTGVKRDYIQAFCWWSLASKQGYDPSKQKLASLRQVMTQQQIESGMRLAELYSNRRSTITEERPLPTSPKSERSSGTGFLITKDGYLVTSEHVVATKTKILARRGKNSYSARVVRKDSIHDLALLKIGGADESFPALPIASSDLVKLGATVATIGFPATTLQGYFPKLSKGDIGSLAGIQDNPRHFQISVPIQPGNSGGALVDMKGNVIGIISHKISQKAALEVTGSLLEGVNYAVKSNYLLRFLGTVSGLSEKLLTVSEAEKSFDVVVDSTQDATVFILAE
jgi:uncharacterized protein